LGQERDTNVRGKGGKREKEKRKEKKGKWRRKGEKGQNSIAVLLISHFRPAYNAWRLLAL